MVQYTELCVHQLYEHSPALLHKPSANSLVRAHCFTEKGAKSFSHQGYPQKVLGLYCFYSQLPGEAGLQPPDCFPDLPGAGHLHHHQAHHCLLRGKDSRSRHFS